MHIGLVFDLRDEYVAEGYDPLAVAEFDSQSTIDELADSLARAGCTVDRVGRARALARRFADGDRWDLVFSIAEGLHGRSREAQVPALCELYDQPYAFSDTLTMAATLDKSVAKHLARAHGIPTAAFAVLRDADECRDVTLTYPLFVKPVAEGTGKGCEAASRVDNIGELRAQAARLIERFKQPVIVERFLPGREVTVGIVGNGCDARSIGVVEVIVRDGVADRVYSFENKEACEDNIIYRLVDDELAIDAAELGLAAYRALECRDAARLDFRADDCGNLLFLEANPIAGLHPSHSDLPIIAGLSGKGYDWLIASIVAAAAQRYDIALAGSRSERASGAA